MIGIQKRVWEGWVIDHVAYNRQRGMPVRVDVRLLALDEQGNEVVEFVSMTWEEYDLLNSTLPLVTLVPA